MENEIQNIQIENKIRIIRNQQVLIDRDLAEMYGVETRVLNQAVKRNIERFPENFMFQLTKEETEKVMSQTGISRSQIVILNKPEDNRGKNIKYLPYAFTEQGVAMLSAVLKSETAVNVSIQIMNAFVSMRRFLQNNMQLFDEIVSLKLPKLSAWTGMCLKGFFIIFDVEFSTFIFQFSL